MNSLLSRARGVVSSGVCLIAGHSISGYRRGRWLLLGILTLLLAYGAHWTKAHRYQFIERNFRAVVPDQVYAGAFQYRLPLERIVEKYHIKTVLSLMPEGFRAEAMEQQVLAAKGVRFERIPISTSKSQGEKSKTVEEFLSARMPLVEEAAEFLADPNNQPVFVHCQAGRHRTGAVVAVFRLQHCGWTEWAARKELKTWGGLDRHAWWPSLALHDFSAKHSPDTTPIPASAQ